MIRITLPSQLPQILKVFGMSIDQLGKEYYDEEQLNVWKSSSSELDKWTKRIENQYFIHYEEDNNIAGFASLENENYIDLMYVNPTNARQGIASSLLTHIENKALQLGADHLISDVSRSALSFFKKQQFEIVKENHLKIDGVEISNFRMMKRL